MTILINSESYEQENTWPKVTKVFNMSAFALPEQRFSTDAQAAHKRVNSNFKMRGLPQLTFFDAAYDVYAHDKAGNPAPCKYPQIVTNMKDGKRKCLDPNDLTAAERAELEAFYKKDAAHVAAQLEAESKKKTNADCTEWIQSAWETSKTKPAHYPSDAVRVTAPNGSLYAWRYQGVRGQGGEKVYRVEAKGGGFDFYSCKTGKKLYHVGAATVKGLGASDGEALIEEAVAKQKKLYKTTEYALIGLFVAGLYLIWRK